MSTGYYLVCPQPNPASVESCAWVEVQPPILPPLTGSQGMEVSGAIILLWMFGWGVRHLIKLIQGAENE